MTTHIEDGLPVEKVTSNYAFLTESFGVSFSRDGISTGIEWLVETVKTNLDRPPRQKEIT